MKKSNKKISKSLVTGIVIVAAAILLVTGLILLPGIQAKSNFSQRLDELLQAPIETATLYDPNLAVGQLGQKGKEIVIPDTVSFRQRFVEIADQTDFATSQRNLGISDYDYRIRFKTTDKKLFEFYIDENQVFWVDQNGIRYYFNIKNTEAFTPFKEMMSNLMN